MKLKNRKAFSLTELLIVLVVIAVLFAAMAPIVTRRAKSDLASNDSVWNYVYNDPERNSYFDSGIPNWSSSAIVGELPDDVDHAKLVIKSERKNNQNPSQIQFRYSPNEATRGNGVNSANILMYNNNLLFGSDFSKLNINSARNAVAGLNALRSINSGRINYITVFGNYAMDTAITTSSNRKTHKIVAVGDHAGSNSNINNTDTDFRNIFIGQSAGSGSSNNEVNDNVAIGYHSMSENSGGSKNVFVGAETGNGFNATDGYNTIIGSNFVGGDNSKNNTVVGYNVYSKNLGRSNITAIGNGACNAVSNQNGEVVCIGYNSAYNKNNISDSIEDSGQHIYIGGNPEGYGGKAVLELHKNSSGKGYVVLNSHLVVRGGFYPENKKIQFGPINSASYYCSEDAYSNDFLGYNGYYCKKMAKNTKSEHFLKDNGSCSREYNNTGSCVSINSDARLKDDIVINNEGIEQILKLVPYNYTFKSDKKKILQVGVIAQDLQKIYPTSVSKDNDGFLKIRWDEMFFGMINAIKDLGAKIETAAKNLLNLENQVSELHRSQMRANKKISSLNKRLNKLEKKYRGSK